ncbi:MAG: hypothetical protein ACOH5I_21445 [Oligoflexus sp.]
MKLKCLHIIWIAGSVMLMSACGNNQLPQKPSIRRASAGEQGSVNEFQAFLQQADQLNGSSEEIAEQFPAILLQSQLRLMLANQSSAKAAGDGESGRCVLFNSASNPFVEEDINDENILISPGGKIAYTEVENFQSSQCQSAFREGMKERFQVDFFNVHASFFSFDF